MPSVPHLFPRMRQGSLTTTYAVCAVMLLISAGGFWEWFALSADVHLLKPERMFVLLAVTIVPLILFLVLAVSAIQRREAGKVSNSYQLRLDRLQKRINAQEDLMRLITDHDPEAIAIFDAQNRYWFVNATTAKFLNKDPSDIVGKSPAKFISHERATKLDKRLAEVRATNKPMEVLHQPAGPDGTVRFFHAHYEPVKPFGDFPGGVIIRAEDVTTLIVERKRRENMLKQVIGTLVAVVDRRDPYAAGHSERVGQLSRAIAEEMVLDEKDIEAAEIAGSLMNFGKVLVPREILTKTGALTPEELQLVRDSLLTSADILSIIEFTGPVVPTLRQAQERFDGTGTPAGLKGGQILITARIVAVANTFVALVSARAHRPHLGFAQAVQSLRDQADKIYDRKVVEALANYITHRAGELGWLTVSG